MQTMVADNVRSLLAETGITTATAERADFAIDHFDHWSNQAAGTAFNCFTGACCVAPPLAEAC
ncbi:hypothetical protein BS329_08615 [Amycolatopsis coloradensis]|uniref:Uncharacterized protein n=1 Tax=Amycolatopsis coloradensis TaxID=76021 RepID=A0A1R0KZ18_9PSEU|nr:hypothetical protein [Amycolatopsis coloradensis]OLZ54575.1 hypothetical protein BS329_08615 [Amycolatopsis coloradensis]